MHGNTIKTIKSFDNTQEDNTANKFMKTAWEMSTCFIVLIIGLRVGTLCKTLDSIETMNFFVG
jgi:hypothetical protein